MKNQIKWVALLTASVFILSGCKTQKQARLVCRIYKPIHGFILIF